MLTDRQQKNIRKKIITLTNDLINHIQNDSVDIEERAKEIISIAEQNNEIYIMGGQVADLLNSIGRTVDSTPFEITQLHISNRNKTVQFVKDIRKQAFKCKKAR
jgi:hypothetical protein